MSSELRLFLIIIVVLYLAAVLRMLFKQKLNLQYSLLWLLTIVILLVISVFPQIIVWLSGILNFEVSSNLVFLISIFFLLMIALHITYTLSSMNAKIVRDTQHIALMEKRIRELEVKLERADKQKLTAV